MSILRKTTWLQDCRWSAGKFLPSETGHGYSRAINFLFLEGFGWKMTYRARIWYYNKIFLKNMRKKNLDTFWGIFLGEKWKKGFSKYRSCWVSKTRQLEVLHLFFNSFRIVDLFRDHFWFIDQKSPLCITCVLFRHKNLISCSQCA